MLVDSADNRNLALSSRNLEGVKLVGQPRRVNVYDLLGHQPGAAERSGGQEIIGGAGIMPDISTTLSSVLSGDRKGRH